jgi:hypothetical protein
MYRWYVPNALVILTERGNIWHLAGALQPTPLPLEGPAPVVATDDAALFFKPRALSQEKSSQWCTMWEKKVWDPRADLGFFTKDTTIPWDAIDDTRVKTINGPNGPVKVRTPTRSRRTISFAQPMTAWELSSDHSIRRKSSDPLGEEDDFLLQEGAIQGKQTEWMEHLTAKDLGSPADGTGWSPQHPWEVPTQRRVPGNRKGTPPATGANYTPVASRRSGSTPPNLPVPQIAKPSIPRDSMIHPVSIDLKQQVAKGVIANTRPGRVSARPTSQFSRDTAPHEGRWSKD